MQLQVLSRNLQRVTVFGQITVWYFLLAKLNGLLQKALGR